MSGLLSLYAYRDSLVHRIDPRVKALWVGVGLIYIFSTDDWRLLLLLLAVNLILAAVARIGLHVLLPVFRALALFGLVILLFQLLFQGGDSFARVGPIAFHTAGLTVTREVWLRLASLSLLCVGYAMWTHPTDIALMWVRFGIPYRYAMMGGLALRFFPILQGEVARIQEAQQVRGRPLHSTWQRITGLVTIVLPFVLRVLRRTNEVAVAMELKGFGYAPTRTFSRTLRMTRKDWAVAAVLVALLGTRLLTLAGRAL